MGLISTECSRKFFFILTQLIGITIIALTLVHIFKYRGGFGGRNDPQHEFCWHVFFMTLGFTYFSSNALVTFRLLPLMSKMKLKLIHFALNFGVIVCASLGLAFVIDEKITTNKQQFQSLHSWIGITAIVLLILQTICGALVYLSQSIPFTWKEKIMPWHIRTGISIFLLGCAAILTGLKGGNTFTEKLIVNFTGASVIVLGFLVVLILCATRYKFSSRWR